MSAGWQVTGLAVFAVLLLGAAIRILFDYRMTPERRERLRRETLYRRGRLSDGMITEASGTAIYYSYCISGVVYTASQDVSQLADYLPPEPERLIGSVWLKYAAQNPANSIVLCEQWSGLPTMTNQGAIVDA